MPKTPKPGTPLILPSFPPPPAATQHTAHGTAKIRKQKGTPDAPSQSR